MNLERRAPHCLDCGGCATWERDIVNRLARKRKLTVETERVGRDNWSLRLYFLSLPWDDAITRAGRVLDMTEFVAEVIKARSEHIARACGDTP